MALGTNKEDQVISEINVTPLVDVMLVLLIIFMVTAPLMLNGINLNLPETKKTKGVQLENNLIVLSYNKDRELFVSEKKVKFSELISKIEDEQKKKGQSMVFLRADEDLPYGSVAKLMSFLRRQGINKISLITEIEGN